MVIAENGIMITETSNFQNRSTHCRKSAIVLTVLMASVLTLESLAALAWYFNIPKIWRDEEPTSVDLGFQMVQKTIKKHLRHVLLWLFDKNNDIKGAEAAREIQEVYGEVSVTEKTCRNWINKFKSGNNQIDDLEDEPRSGRPSNFDDDALRQLVEEDPKLTIRELAAALDSSVGTVHRHLHALGKDSHYCFDQLQICGSNEVCELLATQVSSNGFPMNSTYRCQACTENSTRVLCPDNIEGLSGYEFCGNPEFDFCVVKKAFTEDSRSVKTMELKTCSSAGSITCPKSTVQCCTTERCRYSYKAGDCYCAQ